MADYLYMFKFSNGMFYIGRDLGSSNPYKRSTDHMQGALSYAFPDLFDKIYLGTKYVDNSSFLFKIVQLKTLQKVDQEWGKLIRKEVRKRVSTHIEDTKNVRSSFVSTGNLVVDTNSFLGQSLIEYQKLYNNLVLQELNTNDLSLFGNFTWSYIDLTDNILYNSFNYKYQGINNSWEKSVNLNLFYTLSKLLEKSTGFGKGDVAKLAEFLVTSWYLVNSDDARKILNNQIGDVKLITKEDWFIEYSQSKEVTSTVINQHSLDIKRTILDFIIERSKKQKNVSDKSTLVGNVISQNIVRDDSSTKGLLKEYGLSNELLRQQVQNIISFLLNKWFKDKTIKRFWKEDTKNMIIVSWENVKYNQKAFNEKISIENLKWNDTIHQKRTKEVFDKNKWIDIKKKIKSS